MTERPAAAAAELEAIPPARRLTVALRVAAILLAAGASTDEVEIAMRRIARAFGLRDVQAVVTLGTLMLSAIDDPDEPPLTVIRLVSHRASDYDRLAEAARLTAAIERGEVGPDTALRQLDAIERAQPPHSAAAMTLAMALSAAASAVLFGGGASDALATFGVTILVAPVAARLVGSGLPPFFQTLIAPFLVTLVTVGLVSLGLPIDGGLVIVGGILRFLPGAALVAGMRDLIDRSIISGSARLAEAVLLGSAVAAGIGGGIAVGAWLGGPTLAIGPLRDSPESIVVQAIAAGFAGAFFAVTLGVSWRLAGTVFVLGGVAWFVGLVAETAAPGSALAVVASATIVGVAGQVLALAYRAPSVIWTVPSILPLLPGLTIVQGMLALGSVGGLLTIVSAVVIGFALGAGVAFGAIVVTTVRRVKEDVIDASLVGPVVGAVGSGLERVTPAVLRRPPPGAD